MASHPQVDILLAVDVEGALAHNDLGSYIFMVDTTGYAAKGEGTNELITVAKNGTVLKWAVTPIQPEGVVSFPAKNAFSGQAVPTNIDPVEFQGIYEAEFKSVDKSGTKYQYTCTLEFEHGKTLTFDPYLQVK